MEVKRSKVTKNYFHDSFGQITVFKNEPEKVRKIEKKTNSWVQVHGSNMNAM